MDPVPPSGRCTCRAPLYALRGRAVGEPTLFWCRRCARRYRPSVMPWTPPTNARGGEPEPAAAR